MRQFCPQCGIESRGGELSCECGYVFLDEVIASQPAQNLQVLQIRRKSSLKKVLVFCVLFVLVSAFTIYTSGLVKFSAPEEAQDETEELVASGPNVNQPAKPALEESPNDDTSYKVVKVLTGDTIEIADQNNKAFMISIFGIKAPKLNESFGSESKQYLANLVLGKTVFLRTKESESDSIFVAEVICGGLNVGLVQTQEGFAWLVADQLGDVAENMRRRYLDAELSAKTRRFAVWSGYKENVSVAEMQAASQPSSEPTRLYSSGAAIPLDAQVSREPIVQQYEEPKETQVRQNVPRPAKAPELAPAPDTVVDVKAEPPAVKQKNDAPEMIKANSIKVDPSGPTYTRGPRGGCFYINSKGNKVYVDRSICN